MKIAVLGGTRFFGKRLVKELIQAGCDVTIFSRGNVADDFADKVCRVRGDRRNLDDLMRLAATGPFDSVVDQVCMTAGEAEAAINAFREQTRHYVMTSTMSVYDIKADLCESDFQAAAHQPIETLTPGESYGENKRRAEQAFVHQASFPVAIMRIPIVLGPDDYTERLKNQVKRIRCGEAIYYPNLNSRFSFVHSQDAAEALKWLIDNQKVGAYNIASSETITIGELVNLIESVTSEKARLVSEATSENTSPFAIPSDWYLNVKKSEREGFKARSLSSWLRALIELYARPAG